MKILKTTDAGRAATGYPIEIDNLAFAVAETPGVGGDFVSLQITDEDDTKGHHALELSFAEVEQIAQYAETLREGVRQALKALGAAKRAADKPKTPEAEPEPEQAATNGAGEDEQGDEEADEEAGEPEPTPAETVAAKGKVTRRATRRPRGAAGQ